MNIRHILDCRVTISVFHALTVLLLLAMSGTSVRCQAAFPDVPKDHWAYQAILELTQKGIFTGFPNGMFNGSIPKGIPKPPASYDLSTPQTTWKSLLRAMGNGDENGITRILTVECFEQDGLGLIRFKYCSDDPKQRIKIYRDGASRWKVRVLDPVPRDFSADRLELRSVLVDPDNAPDPFDGWYWIDMKKVGVRWRITRLAKE